jgi:hypothetical protein
MVVTAQKREQSIQDVPISMTAVGGEALRTRGIEGIANLNGIAPNVSFRESPGTTMISIVAIRGAVAGNPAIWMDPPVGMYVDGVYVGKSQGSVFDVVELERVRCCADRGHAVRPQHRGRRGQLHHAQARRRVRWRRGPGVRPLRSLHRACQSRPAAVGHA